MNAAEVDRKDIAELVGVGSHWATESGTRVARRCSSIYGEGRKGRVKLAAVVGVAEPTIAKISLGLLLPRDNLRLALSYALGCEVEDLYPWPTRLRVSEYVAGSAA